MWRVFRPPCSADPPVYLFFNLVFRSCREGRRAVSRDGRRGFIVLSVEITMSSKFVVKHRAGSLSSHVNLQHMISHMSYDRRECAVPGVACSKLLDHSQSPEPTCESCMRRGSVGPARGWSTQPLGPGYVAELRRAARRDARVPAATRGCPPRREGARRDSTVPAATRGCPASTRWSTRASASR
jgi:hypothetical protein